MIIHHSSAKVHNCRRRAGIGLPAPVALGMRMLVCETLKYAQDHVGQLQASDIAELRQASQTTIQVFLDYLDRLRQRPQCQAGLKRLAEDYEPVPPTELKQGLYSENSCMAGTPPPWGGTRSLKDWARRLGDGSLEPSGRIPRQALTVMR